MTPDLEATVASVQIHVSALVFFSTQIGNWKTFSVKTSGRVEFSVLSVKLQSCRVHYKVSPKFGTCYTFSVFLMFVFGPVRPLSEWSSRPPLRNSSAVAWIIEYRMSPQPPAVDSVRSRGKRSDGFSGGWSVSVNCTQSGSCVRLLCVERSWRSGRVESSSSAPLLPTWLTRLPVFPLPVSLPACVRACVWHKRAFWSPVPF